MNRTTVMLELDTTDSTLINCIDVAEVLIDLLEASCFTGKIVRVTAIDYNAIADPKQLEAVAVYARNDKGELVAVSSR